LQAFFIARVFQSMLNTALGSPSSASCSGRKTHLGPGFRRVSGLLTCITGFAMQLAGGRVHADGRGFRQTYHLEE
jgi:hypothetical protein